MKTGTKKFLYTIFTVILALGLGIGAILLSMLNVQASTEMMPGIEQILDEKSEETPFRILELVNNSADAEIGYYISGQEPYLSQYKYTPTNADGTKGETQTFSSVEEGLSVLPTKEQRQKFVEAKSDMVKNPLTPGSAFAWNADNPGTTSETSFPLSFKSYAEKYFLSKTDDASKWNRVELKESRKETLTGHYEENTSGKGDYTKEEQKYYPIREDVDTDGSTTQKYRENIKNFFYSDDTEASAPYQLSFKSVDNDEINAALEDKDDNDTTIADAYDYAKGGFGYYENVYGELTSQITEDIAKKKYTFPGENPVVSKSDADDTTGNDDGDSADNDTNDSDNANGTDNTDGTDTTDTEGEIDIEDTDNLIGGDDAGTAIRNNATTAGTQMNPYVYRGENIEEHPYYKYTLLGDLEYVKQQAENNKGTSKRKDGDITLEDGQYWYWTEESTDNGDEADAESETETGTGSGSDTSAGTGTDSNVGTGDSSTTGDNTGTGTGAASGENSGSSTETSTGTASGGNSETGADVTLKKEALYIVTGRQAVSENQVKSIPEDFTYGYYYKVKSVDYCTRLSKDGQASDPEDYTYYGWYYASHPSNEDTYIEVGDAVNSQSTTSDSADTTEDTDSTDDANTTDETTDSLAAILNFEATHYISKAQYTLTPGKGNYDFIEGTTAKDTEQSVEIDHLFYQGGYTNHDWFKKYVFHLEPDSKDETIQKQFKNLSIKVDTRVINENGTGIGASELPHLADYDLVYINGKISSTQAEKIASTTKLPAIINQEKASGTTEDKNVMDKAFAQWVDTTLTGDDYVSQRIYFINSNLVNKNFSKNFTGTTRGNFKEISDYIKSENNYREVVESGENGKKTDPLSEDISQARVIEYIINYKYKREKAHKDTINVLDIEPASATASLTKNEVRKWLGQTETGEEELQGEKERGSIQNYCCQARTASGGDNGEGSNGGVDKIVDGNAATYWHSKWRTDANNGTKYNGEKPHWFEYKLSSADSKRKLKGIHFAARLTTTNYVNGKPYVLTLEIHKKDGTMVTEKVQFSNNESELKTWTERDWTFTKSVKNVDYIKVIFTDSYANDVSGHHSQDYATCAEFSTLYTDASDDEEKKATEINITHMTSSEFVGHIDDINTEYDAIYFGDSYNNWSFLRNGDVDDNNKKTSLYAHIGGVFGGDKDPENVTTHRSWNVRLMGLLNDDYASSTQLRSSVKSNLPADLQNKIGLMRGSGNDITKQQVKELNDFVSSGYPVIVGNGLLNTDTKSVNTNVVDSSSYMYQFINKAITSNRVNVMSRSEADEKQNLNFFFYLAKPEINFKDLPPEPVRLNNSTYKYNEEAKTGELKQDEDGLSYTFTIENKSEISAATATYDCELFIDLNFDGNLSSDEEQAEYIQIQDANKNVIRKENGKYHLKIGKEYTLTRKIPKDYYKIIAWKLQISNNDNPSIRTSQMGYTKRKAEKQQTINVLQIYPQQKKSDAPVTWNLKTDTDFQNMLSQVKDFSIEINAIDTRTYEARFAEYKNRGENFLDNYQMIIIGFADGFGVDTLSNANGEVKAIRKFIEDGKSVIFAHDTTSFINRDTDNVSSPSSAPETWVWGYTLNTYLRASVGMDRYGITSDQAITVDGRQSTVSAELKKGNDLSAKNGVFKAIQDKVSDMAYMFGNKETTSLMTQGFSNNVLYHVNNVQQSKISTKVNEGAITQYPYYVSDTISTALTHSQYYQLALEEDSDKDGTNDVVVWYCLAHTSGDGTNETYSKYYSESPNDVRNNYYFYSKGNVIYTGVGHRGNGQDGENITNDERQLFANAVIAAANVSAVDPEATFLDDFDPVSNQEDYRYYMPDRLKASEVSGTSNILDGDNTFNLRIRDYNMVASNLNSNSNNSGSLTMELYIEDPDGEEMNINNETIKVKKISVSGKTDTLKKYSDGQIVKLGEDGKFKLPGNDTFQFSLKDMENYLKKSDGTYKKECRIFAKVESSVVLYGIKADKTTWASISLKPRQLFDLD